MIQIEQTCVESILAVDAAVVTRTFAPGFTPTVWRSDDTRWQLRERLLNPKGLWIGPRECLEGMPKFRQLVSYGVVVQDVGAERLVLLADRNSRSGEPRLHGTTTLGFGGHISSQDLPRSFEWMPGYIDADGADKRAIRREIREELDFEPTIASYVPMGVVYDEATEVSRVHVGLVTLVRLEPQVQGELESVTLRDPGLSNPRWIPKARLHEFAGVFETWSLAIAAYLTGGSD